VLLPDHSEVAVFKLPNPPRREPVGGSGSLLKIHAGTAIWAVGLHQLEEVGLCFPVRRLKPSAFDLQAKETGVVALFVCPGPIQTKSGCFIDCRIRKTLNSSISDKRVSRQVVLVLELVE
jgi:hypothetical protein